MTRGTARSLHVTVLLVGGTGLVYAWMRWFCAPADEFAVVNHPWQSDLQHLHLLLAPALVFLVGLVFRDHALLRLRQRGAARRRTGIVLLVAFLPMAVSGYAVQVCSEPATREVWGIAHGGLGALWAFGYLLHLCMRRGPRVSTTAT